MPEKVEEVALLLHVLEGDPVKEVKPALQLKVHVLASLAASVQDIVTPAGAVRGVQLPRREGRGGQYVG